MKLNESGNGGSVLIVNNAESNIRSFVEPIEKIANDLGICADVVEYCDLPLIKIDLYSAIILSGSPCGNDIIDHHLEYYQSIKNYRGPLLGICAGHQILGVMYGATVIKEQEKEIGAVCVNVVENDPIFEGLGSAFEAESMHHDSVSLPPGFTLIAKTVHCYNNAMRKNDRYWVTMQFHPEIKNSQIIVNFLNQALV